MTQMFSVGLALPVQLDDRLVACCEAVFSELLEASATSHQRVDSMEWQIEALFECEPDRAVIDALLGVVFDEAGVASVPVTIAPLAARDWLAENRAAFPPLTIGRFWIYGSHITMSPPQPRLPLLIDASMAFGSGTHPTTEGCLRGLQMIRKSRPRKILDMGCGSAILAMAAGRLWPDSQLVAADNDPVAISVAAKNRTLNQIAPVMMRLAVSRGFGNRVVRKMAPYDLILANILAGPLRRMAPEMAANLARDGWLVLSGILTKQATSVERAYQAQGLRLWRRLTIGEWTTLIMRPAVAGQMPQLWQGRAV